MKIVQTFWSGDIKDKSPLQTKSGWLSPEYNWMSWTLSCLLLRSHYDDVELYTDDVGKKVLIDTLKLPYTKVHVIFDDSFKIHPKLFSLAKIRTYSLQKEPFIHIDGDVFLWKRFPQSFFNAELIASNIEVNLFFNEEIIKEVEQNFNVIPMHLKEIRNHQNIFASNAGIIGGSNILFIKKYCKEAISFIKSNESNLDLVNTSSLNFLIEQVSLYYLSVNEGVPITYYMQRPVDHPLYQDYLRFADIPDVEMVHPVGGCKKMSHILNHLANRLRLEFPNFYYNIIRSCKNENITLNTRLYNYIGISENTNIQNPIAILGTFDSKISELATPNFFTTFKRTIDAARYYFSITVHSHDELLELIQKEGTSDQLKEIYSLDRQNGEMFKVFVNEVINENIYKDEFIRYKESSNFHFTQHWMDKDVIYAKGVKILDLKWDWKKIVEQPAQKTYKRIFSEEASSFYVTLNYNVVHLEIHETYHEGIDEIVLRCIKGKKCIRQILIEVCPFFEDDVTIDSLEYQRLIFDVLKRLAYGNIISFL